jgi:uncharacterized membrane protein YqjE
MIQSTSMSDLDTSDLVRRAAGDSLELVRLELALARDDLRQDLLATKTSALCAVVAAALLSMGIVSLMVALGLALGPGGMLAVGGALVLAAGLLGALAVKKFPVHPLKAMNSRLQRDKKALVEHLS